MSQEDTHTQKAITLRKASILDSIYGRHNPVGVYKLPKGGALRVSRKSPNTANIFVGSIGKPDYHRSHKGSLARYPRSGKYNDVATWVVFFDHRGFASYQLNRRQVFYLPAYDLSISLAHLDLSVLLPHVISHWCGSSSGLLATSTPVELPV